VQVDDVAAYLKKAESLGGEMLVPAVPIPTGGLPGLRIRKEIR